MSQFFAPGGQSIGVSASASVLPVNIQDWSPLGWTGWISLQSKGLSRVFSNITIQKHQFFGTQFSFFFLILFYFLTLQHCIGFAIYQNESATGIHAFPIQLSHPYMTTGKTIALIKWTFVGKVMFLLFNMLSRLVIVFLSRSKHLLISWLQSPSAVILEPKKIKSVAISIVFPFALKW